MEIPCYLYFFSAYIIQDYIVTKTYSIIHAMSTQTPPAALILFSAVLEKSLAFTITGIVGIFPFPRTLKKPYYNKSYVN